jgi:hypothetical protein
VRWVCALILALTVIGTATAADAPHVRQTIVPGRAIGKVALGMSFAHVKKVLGAPEAVISREEGRFGSKRVEYSWSLSEWRVAFLYTAKTNRAVVIRSSTHGEKTKEGIGVGTLQVRVERTYRQRCEAVYTTTTTVFFNFVGRACSLNANGRKTTFLISKFCSKVPPSASSCESRYTRWAVSEIGIFDVGEAIPWKPNPDIRRPEAHSPHVQQRIVPGQAIGKVKLGTSLAQVKKALGAPEAVIHREQGPFGRQKVEYSWNFTEWRIAFRFDRTGSRAVTIRSSIRSERTKEGVGVGTPQGRVETAFHVRCTDAYAGAGNNVAGPFIGRACVLGKEGVARTSFLVHEYCGNVPTAGTCAERDRSWRVSEIGIYAAREPLPW